MSIKKSVILYNFIGKKFIKGDVVMFKQHIISEPPQVIHLDLDDNFFLCTNGKGYWKEFVSEIICMSLKSRIIWLFHRKDVKGKIVLSPYDVFYSSMCKLGQEPPTHFKMMRVAKTYLIELMPKVNDYHLDSYSLFFYNSKGEQGMTMWLEKENRAVFIEGQ